MLRVGFNWQYGSVGEAGARFFLKWSGTTPNLADVTAVATQALNDWNSVLKPLCTADVVINATKCTDLSSSSGAEYTDTTPSTGTRSGSALPTMAAAHIAFQIQRRYRGGHPGIFLPLGATSDQLTGATWDSTFITAVNSAWTSFISGVLGTSGLGTTLVEQENYSAINGYNTVGPFPDGKFKYPGKFRSTAVLDAITGHGLSPLIATQRRRRTSVTA